MVVSPVKPTLEVRAVGAGDSEAVCRLLLEFRNPRMSKEDWRRMLFSYAWDGLPERGYALYAGGEVVGFLGTIFSKRRLAGREHLVCSLSSWLVREAYRTASMLLLKPILSRRDCTIVNCTPSPRAYDIFKKLGFVPLESRRLLLLPIVGPSLVGGSFTGVVREMLPALPPDEQRICRELSAVNGVHHVLLRRGSQQCYLIATRLRVKRLPFAELHYIGNRDFFWSNRALAHWAFLCSFRRPMLALDRRFADGRPVGFALSRNMRRLYRPLLTGTPPGAIDNLYSELMSLKM